jgi:hypothetical protein
MNGIFLIIPNLCPFVPSTNSRRALSLSKDSERFFQQPVRASKDFCQYLKSLPTCRPPALARISNPNYSQHSQLEHL